MAETGAKPLTPYGITPYVARAVARIQEHFKGSDADSERKGEAFVVGVFGEWGSGKSTVLNAIGAAFDNKPATQDPHNAAAPSDVTLKVEFNAWRFEREEHLLIPLLKIIQRTLDDYIESLRGIEPKPVGFFAKTARIAKRAATPESWKWLADRCPSPKYTPASGICITAPSRSLSTARKLHKLTI